MASLAAVCRISARVAARQVRRDATARGLRTSSAALAAQNFTMPALSPTMTEGNIAAWRVKEGEAFQAGDVLLEIETDKATMDVEAQEPGILMKVVQPNGAKGVRVGTRIAVIAEEGDDISSLEIPADEPAAAAAAEAPKPSQPPAPTPAPAATRTPEPAPSPASSAPKPAKAGRPDPNHTLLPSVIHLLKVHGLDASAASQITGTGPHGRILKGDVLAFLGKIDVSAPRDNSARFDKAAHLDLSNIKVAPAPAKPAAKAEPTASVSPPPPPPQEKLVSVPVSLSAVIETQRKIHETLGVFLPLSTFIARASDLANDDLPAAPRKLTADELFNQLVGAESAGTGSVKVSRGDYIPLVGVAAPAGAVAAKTAPAAAKAAKAAKKKSDIIDILASPSTRASKPKTTTAGGKVVLPGASPSGQNLFSLRVPPAEEKRALTFLERVKVVLEKEPGRLVL
ncbi:hypothetical protein VTJ83DRAFT_1138 [Remersonia thermophila]|uniref:Uncharacterized protein n=1 Tax=Remersonia thermophila TaxID=72144 RepID=A0ABR4DNF8_9PEZI